MAKLPTVTGFKEYMAALSKVKEFTDSLHVFSRTYLEAMAELQAELQAKSLAHMSQREFRPRVKHKALSGLGQHSLSFNDQLYTYGLLSNYQELDDSDDRYWWSAPDGERHSSPSMHAAAIQCLMHFCNEEK